MQIRWFFILILLFILNSCAIYGPRYNKPQVHEDKAWVSKDDLAKIDNNINLPDTAWWHKFKDPELDSLIVEALKNNTNIQQAIGNIIQAQGALQQVQMNWVPTVNMNPGYRGTGTFTPGREGFGAQQYTVGGGAGYNIPFLPSYSLNIFQQLRNQDVAKANLLTAKYTKDAVRLTIIGQIAGSYFSLRGFDYLLELQKQLVVDSGKQYELGTAQYKEGYISLLTLQNYQQQYETAKAQVPITKNNIVQTRNAIRVLINRNPGNIARGLDFPTIPMHGIIPANLPSEVLKNRPDIMQAEQQLIAANANIGVATSQFFPTLDLTGATGYSGSQLGFLFSGRSDFWLAQITANMPILNLSIYGQIKGARGAYYAAYYNYIQTVRTAFSQVDGGLSAHDQLTKSYKEQQQVYDSAKLAYNLGDGRFKEGADSYVTLLSYKIISDNAAIKLSGLKVQQLQTIAALYQALAGGYNVNNTEKPLTKFGDGHDAS